MSWDAGFAVDLPNKPVDTDPTGNREQTGRTAGGTDKLLAHVFEQITRVNEEIARAEEKFSKPEHNAPRDPSDPPQPPMNTFRPAAPGSRPSLGARAVRGLLGLMLAACIGIVAIAWQSPSYSGAATQIIAAWAPQLVPTFSPTIEKAGFTIQPGSSPIQVATAKAAPPHPAPLGKTASVVTPAAALESTPLIQSMARDLAMVRQRIDQLKASQEQMTRENANLAEQLRSGREVNARLIAMVSEQKLRPKIPEPLPRPGAAPARRPASIPLPTRSTAPAHAETTQLSAAPRAPMSPR